MELKFENPAGVSQPLRQYSHSVEVPAGAKLVFVSGQVPARVDGTIVSGLAEQADQVYANLVSVLAAKGIALSAIIKLTTFLVDDDPGNVVRQARQKHLGEHTPPQRSSGLAVLPIWNGRLRLRPSRWPGILPSAARRRSAST